MKNTSDEQVKQGKEQPKKPTKELAAEQEFLTKGFDGARTTSIADAAGVTHAMLHYYFRTKEQFFGRILNEKMALMATSMVAVMGNPSLPLVERIGQGIGQHFDFLMTNPELPRFIINEVATQPGPPSSDTSPARKATRRTSTSTTRARCSWSTTPGERCLTSGATNATEPDMDRQQAFEPLSSRPSIETGAGTDAFPKT